MTAFRRSPARIALVAALALAAAFQVVRSTAAAKWVDERPDLAARFWPGHPRIDIALSMAEIGRAAGAGRPAPGAAAEQAFAAARGAPLAVEPFLIKGAMATAEAKQDQAERLFAEAKRRDPRSAAARYFLAQHYLGRGRARDGMAEAAVLSRLVPGGNAALVPGLVQFARTAGAVPDLKRTLAENPPLAAEVLSQLARDADNADLVIALAGGGIRRDPGGAAPAWQGHLLHALVERGDYARAFGLWRTIAGYRGPGGQLFNPEFAAVPAPAPFNWALGSGDFGVAEAVPPASLQVIHYGRSNGDFATQLLLLAPGTYSLAMDVTRDGGSGESGLAWSIDCGPGKQTLLSLPLAGPAAAPGTTRPLVGKFTVPAGCPAQRVRLIGTAREFAASEQAVISRFRLVRGGR